MFKPSNTSALTQPHGINVQSSVYGKTVRLIYGICQSQPDLVWYNDWGYSGQSSNQRLENLLGPNAKQKGGKKGGQRFYSANVDLLLGHAPLRGVLSAWYNNQKLAVLQASASGFISGGAFSFTPIAAGSDTKFDSTVPGSPYQITVPNFVNDLNNVVACGHKLQPASPTPGAGQYTVTTGGTYTFNPAQSGCPVAIHYRQTQTGTAGTLVAIFAVTLAETFSETFNDYGSPTGAVAQYGTWERPLWNTTYAVPGRIDAGAYTARDPYSFTWDGVNPTITVPAALEGFPVTVYYGIPVILDSNGHLFSHTLTPLEILNLDFEREFATGAEYANHPDQQIEMTWVCGLGGVKFDLGTGNTVPQLNLEVLGTFAEWPNGDADIADIVADIIASGPVLV